MTTFGLSSKKTRVILIVLGILLIFWEVYQSGYAPTPPVFSTTLPSISTDIHRVGEYVVSKEDRPNIKPGNQARIVWYNDSVHRTEYSILYLHGFTASHGEGEPTHRNVASALGANLYLSRMAYHGIDTTVAMYKYTADRAWESAKEALMIARQIGKKVIIIGTSAGGMHALMLAKHYPDLVSGLVLYSPAVKLYDPSAFILTKPWGMQVASMIIGGEIYKKDLTNVGYDTVEYKKYWYSSYHLHALVELQNSIVHSMNADTFSQIRTPTLIIYTPKDDTVDPEAIIRMSTQLGVDDAKKEIVSVNSEEHVISSSLTTDRHSEVEALTISFLKKHLF